MFPAVLLRRASAPVDPWYVTLAPKIAQLFLSGPTYQTESAGLISSWENYAGDASIDAVGSAKPTQIVGGNGAYYASFDGVANVLSGMVPVTAVEMLALVQMNSGVEMFGDGAKRLGPIWFPTVNDLLPTDGNSLLNVGTNYANGTATDVWPSGLGWGVVGQKKNDDIAVASSGVLNVGSAFGTFSSCDVASVVWFNAALTAGERALAVAQMLAGAPT